MVITGLTRNQVASRGLEGSNPSVSASATGNAFKRCLFSFRCAGGDGESEPLRGLELHAIGQPRCYILIRFACQQSLKGESLRPYSHSRKCFQALPFFIPLRRRRERVSARARAARDWADGLIFSYILLLPPIAERRIPPSCGVTGTVILSVAFLSRCAGGERGSLRGLELHAIGQPCCYILIRFACQQSLKGESLRLRQEESCLNTRFLYFSIKGICGIIINTEVYVPQWSDSYLTQKRDKHGN